MEELVENAKNGDKEAYTKLITDVKKDLYKVARCKIDEAEDIEDIIQDTIIIAYTKISQLRDNKFFKAWIIKILNNECKKFYINKKREEEINDKYISSRESVDNDQIEEKLEFDNMIKNLTGIDKEIMKLYYEDNLSNEQIAKLLKINTNTVKSKINRSKKKIKFTYKNLLLTALILIVTTTGTVFGKNFANYTKDIFNLNILGRNNEGVVSAIENKDYIQNIDMEYITLNDKYKIRVDYLLMDDINMYMVFDLLCNEEQTEYDRMSTYDLLIQDEQRNTIYSQINTAESDTVILEGWKNVKSNSNKNIRELYYLLSDGYSNIKKLNISFSKITLYKGEEPDKSITIINDNRINISIDIDEKFINRNVSKYVQNDTDDKYNIQEAIITETGFYAIIETTENNIDFILKNENNEYKCSYRIMNVKYAEKVKYYHLILANIELEDASEQIILQNENKNIILNKTE